MHRFIPCLVAALLVTSGCRTADPELSKDTLTLCQRAPADAATLRSAGWACWEAKGNTDRVTPLYCFCTATVLEVEAALCQGNRAAVATALEQQVRDTKKLAAMTEERTKVGLTSMCDSHFMKHAHAKARAALAHARGDRAQELAARRDAATCAEAYDALVNQGYGDYPMLSLLDVAYAAILRNEAAVAAARLAGNKDARLAALEHHQRHMAELTEAFEVRMKAGREVPYCGEWFRSEHQRAVAAVAAAKGDEAACARALAEWRTHAEEYQEAVEQDHRRSGGILVAQRADALRMCLQAKLAAAKSHKDRKASADALKDHVDRWAHVVKTTDTRYRRGMVPPLDVLLAQCLSTIARIRCGSPSFAIDEDLDCRLPPGYAQRRSLF